jgi:hypothetical protein
MIEHVEVWGTLLTLLEAVRRAAGDWTAGQGVRG